MKKKRTRKAKPPRNLFLEHGEVLRKYFDEVDEDFIRSIATSGGLSFRDHSFRCARCGRKDCGGCE